MSEHGHGYPASPSQPFKTVAKQIEKISTILKGAAEDWKPRFSSLVELERLVNDLSIYTDFKQYFNDTTLAPLTQPLQVQMLDLRSEIVRQASSTISTLAQHVNTHWTRAANKLIPTLLQAATAANIVIKGYAHTCLNNVVAACQSPNIAQTILTEIKTCKSEVGRQTCMELVREMILLWSPRMYRRHMTLLEDAILFGLRGASLPTRVAAAGCYWAYADSEDEQNAAAAVKLLASADARLKKFIATQKETVQAANEEIKQTYKQERNIEDGDHGDDGASDAGSDLSHVSDVDVKSPRSSLTPLHTSQSTPVMPAAASASKRTSTTKTSLRPPTIVETSASPGRGSGTGTGTGSGTGTGATTTSTTTSNATTTGAAATRIQALIKGRRARTMIKERVGTGSLVSVGMRVRVLADSEMFPVSSSSSDTEAAHAGASAYGVVLFIGQRDGKTGEWAQVQLDPEPDATDQPPRTMFTRRHNLQPESWRPQDDDTFAAAQAAAEAGAPISATYTPERTKKPATLRISKSTSSVSRHRSRVGDWNLGGSGSNSASGSATGSTAGSRSASRPSSRLGSRSSSPASSAPSSPRNSTRSALPYATASLRKSTGTTNTSTAIATASAPPTSRSSSLIQPATATATATSTTTAAATTSSAFIDSLFDMDNDPPYPVEYEPTRSASNSITSQTPSIHPPTQTLIHEQPILTQGIIQRAQSEPTPAPAPITSTTSTSTLPATATATVAATAASATSTSPSPTPSHSTTPSRSPVYSPTPSPRTTAADIAAHRSATLPRSHIPYPNTHDNHQHHHHQHQQHPTHHHATVTPIEPIVDGVEQTQAQLAEQLSNLIRDHKTHVQQSAIHLQQLNLLLSVGRSSPDYSDRMITLLSDHLTKASHLLENFTKYKLALSSFEAAQHHKQEEQDDFLEGHDNFAT